MANIISKIGKESAEVSAEILEATLDQLLDDGFWKDVPIAGTFAKIWGMGKKVSEAMFLKKIVHFFDKLKDISEDEKEKFLSSLSNEKEQTKLNDLLIVYLDKFAEVEKAKLLGKLFKAFVKDKLKKDDFLQLAWATERCYWGDMEAMLADKSPHFARLEVRRRLADFNLYNVETKVVDGKYPNNLNDDNTKELRTTIEPSKLGKILYEIANQT